MFFARNELEIFGTAALAKASQRVRAAFWPLCCTAV